MARNAKPKKRADVRHKPGQTDLDARTRLRTVKDKSGATLTRHVYEQIRAEILTGKLRPGEKLRTEVLRTRFNTASSPVREALNRLYSAGFVTLEEQKGFRVAPVSHEELQELVTARCWIDGAAIRESIRRYDTSWEENLILALHRLSKISRPQGHAYSAAWEHLHKGFHMALISGCGNRWISRVSAELFDAAERYRLLAAGYIPGRNELEEHRAIVDACMERQADKAVQLLTLHYGKTHEIVVGADSPLLAIA